MARPHDAVGGELIFRAQVAGQAEIGARRQIVRGIEAVSDVVRMGRFWRRMARDPILRAAVAGLAANAVGDIEFHPALRHGHVIGMAVEAEIGLVSLGQAQVLGNALGLFVQQDVVGPGVPVVARPGDVLVLQHVRPAPLHRRPMANAGGAAGHALVQLPIVLGQHRTGASRQQEAAEQRQASNPSRVHHGAHRPPPPAPTPSDADRFSCVSASAMAAGGRPRGIMAPVPGVSVTVQGLPSLSKTSRLISS